MELQCLYAYPNQTDDIDIFIEIGRGKWYSKKEIYNLLEPYDPYKLEFRMKVTTLGEFGEKPDYFHN